MKIVRDDEVPKFTGAKKMSLHQTGFQEVLSAADLLAAYPETLALIGCQPLDLEDWGGPLTEPVRATLDHALDTALAILAEWGITVEPRVGEIEADDRLLANDIDFAAYERRVEA
jgi:hydrogenase maturation protease